MQEQLELLQSIFKSAGFGVTMKNEGVLVWLNNRRVYEGAVNLVLIAEELDELCTAKYIPGYQATLVSPIN